MVALQCFFYLCSMWFQICTNTSSSPVFLPCSSASVYKHRTYWLSLSVSWPIYTEVCQHLTFLKISSSVRDLWDHQQQMTVTGGWEAGKLFLAVWPLSAFQDEEPDPWGIDMLSFCMKNCSDVILLNSEAKAALYDRWGLRKMRVCGQNGQCRNM